MLLWALSRVSGAYERDLPLEDLAPAEHLLGLRFIPWLRFIPEALMVMDPGDDKDPYRGPTGDEDEACGW